MSTERERFEAWFTRDGDYEPEWLVRSGANQGMYLDSETEKLWEAWKAAIDAHLKEPVQDEHTPSYAEAFDAIERGAAILTSACDDALDRLAALPQPAAVPSEVRLSKVVVDFLCAVDEQHDTKGLPLKYTVPWGALNALREAIGATPLQPNGDKP